jgi:hypothetical protein
MEKELLTKERELDGQAELARANALDLIKILANPRAFPNKTINKLMKSFSRLLKNPFDTDLQATPNNLDTYPYYERQYPHGKDEPPVHVLVVPYTFTDIFSPGDKDEDKEANQDLLASFVRAVSLTKERGEREDWAESRVREFKETMEKTSLEKIRAKAADAQGRHTGFIWAK